MFKKSRFFLIVVIMILPCFSYSQPEFKNSNLSVETGLGFASIGSNGGANLRLSMTYLSNKWGVEFRRIHQVGKKIASGRFYSASFPIKEQFVENAILVTRLIKKGDELNFVASIGLGSISQKEVDVRFENELGFAFDIGVKTMGKFFGFSSYVSGNINSESVLIGLTCSFTFNLSW